MNAITTSAMERRLWESVSSELEWDPRLQSMGIGVAVRGGVVTLTGEVRTCAEKVAAVHAVMGVRGVTAVADELTVRLEGGQHSDTEIASAIVAALRWNDQVPTHGVKVAVGQHVVTLSGVVDWDYQRHAAVTLAQHVQGVTRVINQITLGRRPSAPGAEARITEALIRHARTDAQTIRASVEGGRVTLSGHVQSWAERQQAERAAWSSPQVTAVVNHIVIDPS